MSGIHGDYKEPIKHYFNHSHNHGLMVEDGMSSIIPDIMPSFIGGDSHDEDSFSKGQQLGDIFNRRLEAIRQQMSQFGTITPAQQESFGDATKSVALQNFAETTKAQMIAKVLRNWEKKMENYITNC